MDWVRQERTGVPEAVLCSPKSPAQIEAVILAAECAGRPLLLTRLAPPLAAELPAAILARLDYDVLSATAFFGEVPDPATLMAGIGIVAAGTSDLRVAREAARTLAFCGFASQLVVDVGVAGLWRLVDHVPQLALHRVVIAVAGMEGALFSVLAGLLAAPVIAVPTSIGYGVAAEGRLALYATLGSCAPRVVAVNIRQRLWGGACGGQDAAYCTPGLTRRGFALGRARDRVRAKLKKVKDELRRRMQQPIPAQGKWLAQKRSVEPLRVKAPLEIGDVVNRRGRLLESLLCAG